MGFQRVVCNIYYKGSAPRAADAAHYARARENATKCEGGTKIRGPWFGATILAI